MSDSRLDDMPRMRWGTVTIPAKFYNQVRLGLLRLANPLRIETGLRDLDIILEDTVWYCVDRSLNDLPVVAWDEFRPRSSLHEPVECRISIYHIHAERILDQVLQAANLYIQEQLARRRQAHHD